SSQRQNREGMIWCIHKADNILLLVDWAVTLVSEPVPGLVCQRGHWALKRGLIVVSHIGCEGERNMPYKSLWITSLVGCIL
ncbi:Unknown protein, partial [Striga hermonthica]